MADTLEINGKFLHSIKDASDSVSYSRDYITRLAREKKISATYVGRQWFVNLKSLKSYVETSALEQEIRKKQLSDDRKKENQIREATRNQHTLHLKKAKSLHARSLVVASLVLMFGLTTGFVTNQLISFSGSSQLQVANTFDAKETPSPIVLASEKDVQPTDLVVNVQSSDFVEFIQTEEIRPIGDIQNGVLLLPSVDEATVVEMLSDKVLVKKLPDGTEVVVRVDAAGNEVGNPVPFVSVPVEHQEIQI